MFQFKKFVMNSGHIFAVDSFPFSIFILFLTSFTSSTPLPWDFIE